VPCMYASLVTRHAEAGLILGRCPGAVEGVQRQLAFAGGHTI